MDGQEQGREPRRRLEVCAESPAACEAAEAGGADRVELCADLDAGGLTPSEATMRAARARCGLPLLAMIRPRPGSFRCDSIDLRRMELDVERARASGMDGVVVGAVDERGDVDERALARLVRAAAELPVTFHRAFDLAPDPSRALRVLADHGVHRVLSSGGAPTALAGATRLARLVAEAAEAGGRVTIVVAGGVRESVAARLVQATGARDYHSSLDRDAGITPERVRRLAELLRTAGRQ